MAILETAIQISELGIEPRNNIRFAFWSGEEDGLVGSDYYVAQLTKKSDQGSRREPELRHGGLAELGAFRLRR